jgi:hypothetical protein
LNRIEEATSVLERRRSRAGPLQRRSTHNRAWPKSVIEYLNEPRSPARLYGQQQGTAHRQRLSAIRKNNVGVFGIKPFADNSLFKGDSTLTACTGKRTTAARALPAVHPGQPGDQRSHTRPCDLGWVDNAAKAIMERRKLDHAEKAEFEKASREMWANLRPSHRWLRHWEHV